MGQVVVKVNGRSYRFDCGDGEESRLYELADFVKARLDALTQQYGHAGSERLLLMAALLITDELMDARAALAAKGESGSEDAGQSNGQAAHKREQDAIRSEHRRRAASGEV
jgi:cell division protein ZapA